jgi:hypothetical protein
MHQLSRVLLFAALLCLSRQANADPPGEASGDADRWRLTVSAGTHFPVDVGARVQAEGPLRLQLATGVGVMPGPYVDFLNTLLVELGAYSDTEAALIEAALHNSLIWRTHVGWRPFPRSGFYVQLGYTLVALGGGLTAAEAISAVTGRPVPDEASSGGVEVTVDATLHQLSGEVGWQWMLGERWMLQASVGGFGTLAASTQLSAPNASRLAQLALEPLFAGGEDYLNDTFTSYVHGGTVGVRLGYSF